ncbi:hypothetical protein EU92_0932 [Prochlorococcus marinus str. MIT 9107]|uniref:Uncharacterized protein n=1 Tax=Prochlorococcus marinus str. MIT 9116 TaxID=167544 RepID=A0A0A1ZYU3_PROMR|nr:hypothetical protein EU92_0932 [Prochlorococcus marinus str. MIT 9107]KGF93588.1 hypothetical protein EU94_1223 [Prochlorococcus marinus str. MIT 9123]KGF93761.1 hypothetical protein EU93_0071 [Prochlorococcus marinus str. MIT 9116]
MAKYSIKFSRYTSYFFRNSTTTSNKGTGFKLNSGFFFLINLVVPLCTPLTNLLIAPYFR